METCQFTIWYISVVHSPVLFIRAEIMYFNEKKLWFLPCQNCYLISLRYVPVNSDLTIIGDTY